MHIADNCTIGIMSNIGSDQGRMVTRIDIIVHEVLSAHEPVDIRRMDERQLRYIGKYENSRREKRWFSEEISAATSGIGYPSRGRIVYITSLSVCLRFDRA